MIRTVCLVDISTLLRGGLERRGCIVSRKQSVAAEKCVVFWKGPAVCWGGGRGQRAGELWAPSTIWLLFTRWASAQSFIKGHKGENETFPWLGLISLNEGKHHNKCHLAFWSRGRCGRSDESPISAFNRALLSPSPELTVTQSRMLNCMLGFHADTECTSHGWESQRRKNSLIWQ